MKNKIILFIIGCFVLVNINAQESGRIRAGLDLGYVIPKGGGGGGGGLEVKLNLADNMNIGLRYEGAFMAREINGTEGDIKINSTFIGTGDYYFNNGDSSFAPFLGSGIGVYTIAGGKVNNFGSGDNYADVIDSGYASKFGGLVRGGFEYGKFRTTLTYNIIPDIKYVSGKSTKNSYFSITIGFYIGGGKWKNNTK